MTRTVISLQDTGQFVAHNSTTPIAQFQVLGERGSGTNVVRKTIEKNVDIMRVETLGWKHGFPHMVGIPDNLVVVCVVRNAWDWVRSMHQRPWHVHPDQQALPFSDFIRAEWTSIVDRPADFEMLSDELDASGRPLQLDRHPITGHPFANIFQLRRAKLSALEGLINRNCSLVFVRLETFNQDQEGFVAQFCEDFDLTPKSGDFKPVTVRMGNAFNHSGAARHGTPEQPDAADLEFLKAELDLEQEARMGYFY